LVNGPLFTVAFGVLANTVYGFLCWILPQISVPARTRLGEVFWRLPVTGLLMFSAFLIILALTIGLYTGAKKAAGRKTKKVLPLIAVITGLLGLTGLTSAGATSILTGMAPFKRIVIADNASVNKSVVLTRSMSDLWLRIDGIPMNENSGDPVIELRRTAPGSIAAEPLDISGLKRDWKVDPGNFYFPRQGRFRVPGPFMAGDSVEFKTENTSGFEGEISFEFWEIP
jgi:hypothetical protein